MEKLPLEKRDSIISEKKISPNGQGLYFPRLCLMCLGVVIIAGNEAVFIIYLSEGKMKILRQ